MKLHKDGHDVRLYLSSTIEQLCTRVGAATPEAALRLAETATVAHDAPEETCTCGIYALKHLRDDQPYHRGANVFGTVTLWGKVIEGDKGARAQFAYPSQLYVSSYRLEQELQAYGVPIFVRAGGWWDKESEAF